jgi:hypothetical protein
MMSSDDDQTRLENTTWTHTTNTTTMVVEPPGQPVWRGGFNESMPPKGLGALRIFFMRPHWKGFNRFISLK